MEAAETTRKHPTCEICTPLFFKYRELQYFKAQHSDPPTVHSPLSLSVFVARFWLPVVSLGSHSSLVCNPKQSKLLRVFSMASFFGLCLWNRTFLSDLSRSTDANRSTFGCRFQSSSFLFHCSFPFFFFFANSLSLVFLLFWMRILCTEELVSAKARRKTPSAKRASTSKTDGKVQRSTGRSTGR